MEKVTFKVNGIENDTEKLQLKNALVKIKGVNEIAVDRVESTVEVEYNPPATELGVRECIEGTGRAVKGVETDY